MNSLKFYVIFHGNLQFSSIPKSEYKKVVNNCYWPLIKIADTIHGLKIGVEFSGETLLEIKKIDGKLLNSIQELVSRGKLEFVGSGYSQTIFPLIPAEVNLLNLKLSKETYKQLLGFEPSVYFVNEQTVSDGIISVYKKSNIENIISDFDSAPERVRSNSKNLYSPTFAISQSRDKIRVLWSSSIAFQKFQRCIFDEISENDYFEYIKSHADSGGEFFPLYCGDWEVFGFSPKKIGRDFGSDVAKMDSIFRKILNKKHKFVLPSEALKSKGRQRVFSLVDSENPVYSKKQMKYNPSRWALAGKHSIWRNTNSHRLFQKISNLRDLSKILGGEDDLNSFEKELVSLWGSDFRTFTSVDKNSDYDKRVPVLHKNIDRKYKLLLASLSKKPFVINLSDKKINSKVVSLPLNSSQRGGWEAVLNGKQVPSQVEPTKIDEEGKIISRQIVFVANLLPLEIASIKLVPKKKRVSESWKVASPLIETENINLELDVRKGATIKNLQFKKVDSKPLIGLIPHGFYRNPELSADWFTGHCIFESDEDKRYLDLVRVDLKRINENFPIRIPIFTSINLGEIRINKTYYVYLNQPRVDIKYSFSFGKIGLKSARIGNVTLKPLSFSDKKLYLIVENGGLDAEKYQLSKTISQDELVSFRISSRGCLGSTGGWLAVGDDSKHLGVFWDKSELAACPIVHFERTPQGQYGRIQISIGESDETGYPEFEGEKDFTISYIARKKLDELRDDFDSNKANVIASYD